MDDHDGGGMPITEEEGKKRVISLKVNTKIGGDEGHEGRGLKTLRIPRGLENPPLANDGSRPPAQNGLT